MTEPVSPRCPFRVSPMLMHQRWDSLSFLHWRYPVDVVRGLLPDGLVVDAHDGSAWVGLVPFRMRVRLPGLPELPWLGSFCETNLRTYVLDREGRRGVWFFSLDAERLLPVLAGRAALNLSYQWSSMSLQRDGDLVSCWLRRRGPGPRVRSRVSVRWGPPYEPTETDHFLTARWRLFSATPLGLVEVLVEHPPWPLREAVADRVDHSLLVAGGLPVPEEAPVAVASDGVDVRVGMPRRR